MKLIQIIIKNSLKKETEEKVLEFLHVIHNFYVNNYLIQFILQEFMLVQMY